MAVSGQWLARRLQRGGLAALERLDPRAIKHRDCPEQHASPVGLVVVGGLAVAVRVQRVVSPGGAESWTVIGGDLRPVEPVDRYLAWLSSIERAPTTVRVYAHDLKTFWRLRSPADNVAVPTTGRPARAASTVNRILTAVFGFYEFHARHGVQVARALVDDRRMGRGSFKPFLHGIAPARPRGLVSRSEG